MAEILTVFNYESHKIIFPQRHVCRYFTRGPRDLLSNYLRIWSLKAFILGVLVAHKGRISSMNDNTICEYCHLTIGGEGGGEGECQDKINKCDEKSGSIYELEHMSKSQGKSIIHRSFRVANCSEH